MEFTALQVAEMLGGTVEGDQEVKLNDLSKIEEGKHNSLSFLANPAYTEHIYDTKASAVVVAKDFKPEKSVPETCTLIKVDDPRQSFAKLLEAYSQFKGDKTGIHASAIIEESSTIGNDCYIGAQSYIGENVNIGNNVKIYPNSFIGNNCKIGDNTIIYAGCKMYDDTQVGKNCTIHAGVVLGGDGFGFAPNSENNYHKVPHIGNVILEDHVEVGANTTIDKATLGSTIIRKGVKLDNLIQVAHNVEIGENTVIAAQTGIAGSTKIGKNCMIGGQVGIVGHIKIGNGAKVAAQSGIGHSINSGAIVQGSPAFHIGDYKRSYVMFRSLPNVKERLDKIEKSLNSLKEKAE